MTLPANVDHGSFGGRCILINIHDEQFLIKGSENILSSDLDVELIHVLW